MRNPTIDYELFEEQDDGPLEPLELGFSVDLARADLEQDGELGLRALYELPDRVVRRARKWMHAA